MCISMGLQGYLHEGHLSLLRAARFVYCFFPGLDLTLMKDNVSFVSTQGDL